jgi:hypothetical protein
VGLQEPIFVVGARLTLAPVGVKDVLARIDQLAGVRHGPPIDGVSGHAVA